ncbi:hypothetical protein C8R46DRAFT_1061513 [Mycena filopes]|nr:hypothetical protein C8R46DRAFT_1061513 [Mycena filopes]
MFPSSQVVNAAGAALLAVEPLPQETTRHFACDAATGEMLWFPGAPPMHVARAAPPLRHRLEYLHFLAKKYTPELAVDAVDEKADMTADAKPQQQKYISASERVTEILDRDYVE